VENGRGWRDELVDFVHRGFPHVGREVGSTLLGAAEENAEEFVEVG
jgi:hypothetical protein